MWGWGGSEVTEQLREGKRRGGCSMSREREGGTKGGMGALVAWMGPGEPHM